MTAELTTTRQNLSQPDAFVCATPIAQLKWRGGRSAVALKQNKTRSQREVTAKMLPVGGIFVQCGRRRTGSRD